MLVLERKRGQSIFVQTPVGQIEIHISQIRGERVKVALDAPESVLILREELMPSPTALQT